MPQVQKVLISSEELNDNDVIDGLLKMSDETIIISASKLSQFEEKYKESPWMTEFSPIMKYIKDHERIYYSFTQNEVLSNSQSSLGKLEKIEICNILKAFSIHETIIRGIEMNEQNKSILAQIKK